MIQAIDKASVQKICCGQVVVDLATAVKELLENSLDSGATSIEIKLKEMGTEMIEVTDNGSGIDPENYESLALKHCTSKLSQFSELSSVQSFGFRGEALNALCELSGSLRITTKTADAQVGSELSFSRNGSLLSQKPTSRNTGSTVCLERLFEALPVRRGEFVRSAKKQYVKLLKVMQSYALILCGVKITVINTSKTGGRKVVLATQCSTKIEDNISNVFGSKFLSTLLALSVTVDDSEAKVDREQQEGEAYPSMSDALRCVGFVSKPREGVGRSDSDRQYVFCNGRPVDLPRVNRLFNEMWRRYEMSQKPAFILNIVAPPGAFDINLSPDKREVVFAKQKNIIEALQSALEAAFEPSRNTFPVLPLVDRETHHLSQTGIAEYVRAAGKNIQSAVPASPLVSTDVCPSGASQCYNDAAAEDLSGPARSAAEGNTEAAFAPSSEAEIAAVTAWLGEGKAECDDSPDKGPVGTSPARDRRDNDYKGQSRVGKRKRVVYDSSDTEDEGMIEDIEVCPESVASPRHSVLPQPRCSQRRSRDRIPPVSCDMSMQSAAAADDSLVVVDDDDDDSLGIDAAGSIVDDDSLADDRIDDADLHCTDVIAAVSPTQKWTFVPESALLRFRAECLAADPASGKANDSVGLARGEIEAAKEMCSLGNTCDVARSEAALTRIICKEDFKNMIILGQFNVGFIIAELRGDLYILDQHACDEKYRFEKLRKSTTLHKQTLIVPLPLDTSPREEAIITSNLDIFAANGFQFVIDENATPGNRIKVTTLPLSQSVQFGVKDIHDLASLIDGIDCLFSDGNAGNDEGLDSAESHFPSLVIKNCEDMLRSSGRTDSGNMRKSIRLPRLVSVFASRACRSAVMIGTHLKLQEMRHIVDSLGTIEQPWNCPHGRPTMRHLIDLEALSGGATAGDPKCRVNKYNCV